MIVYKEQLLPLLKSQNLKILTIFCPSKLIVANHIYLQDMQRQAEKLNITVDIIGMQFKKIFLVTYELH